MKDIQINGQEITVQQINEVALANATVSLSEKSKNALVKSKQFVFDIVEKGEPVYGINTGFGALSDVHIKNEDLNTLQVNLIRSHCTGVGAPFDRETTRAIMLLRANCLVSGYSGINPEAVELLLDFLNHDILPIVPFHISLYV
jgi:histidine ammonia-lyase